MPVFLLTTDGSIATLTFNHYKAADLQRMDMVRQVVPTAQLHDAALSLTQSLTGRRQDAVE
jgi:enoyl-CoA hydratase/carnithine racemase